MARSTLVGTRIRQRRTFLGIKQATLAKNVGVSPSYLNLIEHNRRRIGGKLVVDLARALSVDPAALTEGVEATLLGALREAAVDPLGTAPEMERIEELVGRLPGWAALVTAQHRRIAALERTVETLTDRLTHDPHLATSLHEMISTVTSIRATSAILRDTDDIEPEWQSRFQRNIAEDSDRLAETSQALVSYLDGARDAERTLTSPQEELEAYLERVGYHITELERPLAPEVETVINAAPELRSKPARTLAEDYLLRYRRDAQALPIEPFRNAAQEAAFDPGVLSQRFGVDLATVFRRLAALPQSADRAPIGLVICDGSGTLTFRKATEGFVPPRFGAACPLWPLYQALGRPMAPVRATLTQAGTDARKFMTYAISQPLYPGGFDGPQVFEASMLIVPLFVDGPPDRVPQVVGTSCRICPRTACPARREPSILADGF